MDIKCSVTVTTIQDLAYKDLYVNGEIDGLEDLNIGRGVSFTVQENVRTQFVKN